MTIRNTYWLRAHLGDQEDIDQEDAHDLFALRKRIITVYYNRNIERIQTASHLI